MARRPSHACRIVLPGGPLPALGALLHDDAGRLRFNGAFQRPAEAVRGPGTEGFCQHKAKEKGTGSGHGVDDTQLAFPWQIKVDGAFGC